MPIKPFAQNRAALRSAVDQLFPEDDTALYQATSDGLAVVKKQADTSRINAVVLLTDGQDTAGGISEGQVLDQLRAEGDAETGGVRLYTIAYGSRCGQGSARQIRGREWRKGVRGGQFEHRLRVPVHFVVLLMARDLDRPPTRSELNRELMLRAATSWDGLVALAVVAGAGVVLGLPVLILLAIVLWLGASVWHYFDGSEADKLAAERAARRAEGGRGVAAESCGAVRAGGEGADARAVAGGVDPADDHGVGAAVRADGRRRRLGAGVRADGAAGGHHLPDAGAPEENGQGAADLALRIDQLSVGRARRPATDEKELVDALSAQLAASRRAEELRDRFFTTMERMVAELGTIDSEIIGMSATEAASSQQQVAGQLSELRELVSGLAGDMQKSSGGRRPAGG